MALHLPIGPLKPALDWSRYRDAIPVPTSPLPDDSHFAIGAGIRSHSMIVLYRDFHKLFNQ